MKFFLIGIYIFFGFSMFSQARLNISSGSSVYFHFNSYQKYVDGITYNDFTKLSIFYNDTTSAGSYSNWKIDVKALTSDINGEISGNTLNLDVIELEASGAATGHLISLSDADNVTLVDEGEETNSGEEIVFVTYYCGRNAANSLLGKEPDYYVVDILFTLTGY